MNPVKSTLFTRFVLIGLATFTLLAVAPLRSQTATYSWSGYTAGATSYTTGIMIATVTLTSVSMQYTSPKYYAAGAVGSGQCGQANGLALECLFGNITTSAVNLKMDFTNNGAQNGTCASVKFIIKDINADESVQTFADWVVVSAIDANNTAVPAANITINLGSSTSVTTSGTTKIIKGYSGSYGSRSSSACNTTTVTVAPPAGVPLKSITLNYHPDYTACASCYYNFSGPLRPAYQYISIGQLDATTTGGTGCTVTTLPVEMTSFTGTCEGDKKTFAWETASEKNNHYFTLEGSNNSTDFEELARVEGAGNSMVSKKYSVQLDGDQKGYAYFRVKQTDFNGATYYSKMIYTNCKNDLQNVALFPNPAQGLVGLVFENEGDFEYEIVFMDALGRAKKEVAFTPDRGTNQLFFDISDLPAGLYYAQVIGRGKTDLFKPVKFVKE